MIYFLASDLWEINIIILYLAKGIHIYMFLYYTEKIQRLQCCKYTLETKVCNAVNELLYLVK